MKQRHARRLHAVPPAARLLSEQREQADRQLWLMRGSRKARAARKLHRECLERETREYLEWLSQEAQP